MIEGVGFQSGVLGVGVKGLGLRIRSSLKVEEIVLPVVPHE